MRKRIEKKPKLVATTHIPRDCAGELARAAMKFMATVQIKDNSKISLKTHSRQRLEVNE